MTPEDKIGILKMALIHEMAIHDMVDHADLPLAERESMVEEHLKRRYPEIFGEDEQCDPET